MYFNDDNHKKKPSDKDKSNRSRDDYQRIFHTIERLMHRAYRDITMDDLKPGILYKYGFHFYIDKDGTLNIEEFNNYQQDNSHNFLDFSNKINEEPYFDIIEYDDIITVTFEIIGICKNDIQIDIIDNELIIIIFDDSVDIYECIELPSSVISSTLRYSYNKGVLDIMIDKY